VSGTQCLVLWPGHGGRCCSVCVDVCRRRWSCSTSQSTTRHSDTERREADQAVMPVYLTTSGSSQTARTSPAAHDNMSTWTNSEPLVGGWVDRVCYGPAVMGQSEPLVAGWVDRACCGLVVSVRLSTWLQVGSTMHVMVWPRLVSQPNLIALACGFCLVTNTWIPMVLSLCISIRQLHWPPRVTYINPLESLKWSDRGCFDNGTGKRVLNQLSQLIWDLLQRVTVVK